VDPTPEGALRELPGEPVYRHDAPRVEAVAAPARQDVVLGVAESEPVVDAHRAREDDARPEGKPRRERAAAEPRRRDFARAVAHRDHGHGPAAPQLDAAPPDDFSLDGADAAGRQGADRNGRAPVLVRPREMEEQIAHRADAELRQQRRPRRPDAGQGFDGAIPWARGDGIHIG